MAKLLRGVAVLLLAAVWIAAAFLSSEPQDHDGIARPCEIDYSCR